MDQLPGYIASMDATQMLIDQRYIPSYNIPYFSDVMDLSGYTKAGYSYFNDTRAKIFRRDQGAVNSLDSMCTLMNSNNYKTDPLADNNPCNAISARCDLATEAFGGIDSKNVDRAAVLSMRVRAIGAPTHEVQPVFAFSHGYMVGIRSMCMTLANEVRPWVCVCVCVWRTQPPKTKGDHIWTGKLFVIFHSLLWP